MPEANYKRMLVDMKLPEAVAELIADADTGASRGALEDGGRQLSALIGRPTAAWRQAVERASSAGDRQ
jgi:NAD(P)H dehydrogenase (quinone)